MLPTEVCVDANVFVASLIREETDYEAALQTVTVIQENDIALFEPEIVLFEFGTAVYRKGMTGDIKPNRIESLLDLLFRLPLVLQWNASLMQKAVSYAERLSFRGIADCCYLALAEKRDIPLITLDTDLLQKGKGIFRKIMSPGDFVETFS